MKSFCSLLFGLAIGALPLLAGGSQLCAYGNDAVSVHPHRIRAAMLDWRDPGLRDLIPAGVRRSDTISERQLAVLIKHASKMLGTPDRFSAAVTHPAAPVLRIRALAALIKLVVAPDELAPFKIVAAEALPVDRARIPEWGKPYAAYAVEQGWWSADRPLHPRDLATWSFASDLLLRLPLVKPAEQRAAEPDTRSDAGDPKVELYTGLLVDARELRIERDMGPRILDEDGQVVYPDASHMPDFDTLQDRGMADYYTGASEAKRVGEHPFEVRALSISGAASTDVVVSNETAAFIREANKRGKFLQRWRVGILVSPK